MSTRRLGGKTLPKGLLVDRDYLYLRLYERGVQIQKSVGRADDPGAIERGKEMLAEWRRKLRLRRLGLELKPRSILFEEGADIFWKHHASKVSSSRNMEQRLRMLKGFFAGKKLEEITYLDVEAFRREREKKIKPNSVNAEQNTMMAMYFFLDRWNRQRVIDPIALPPHNPAAMVKRPHQDNFARTRIVSPDEFKKLMDAAQPNLRRIILAAVQTSLRICDLKNLSKANINEATNQLEGFQQKSGKRFTIPINSLFRRLIETAPEDKLLDFKGFGNQWLSLKKACGLHASTQFRDLRRTAGRTMLREGLDLASVSSFLGHTNLEQTVSYVAAPDADKRRGADVLQGIFRYEEAEAAPTEVRQ
jgi:site-specific recombinase XerD